VSLLAPHGPEERALPPAQRPSSLPAKDYVYGYVKGLIVDLVLAPGSLTTEMEIAGATGVSRTPVREAFLRLDAEGLLRLLPRRGAVVAPVTVRQVRELNETRLVLEAHAAREACAQRLDVATPMRELLDRQTAMLEEGSRLPEIVACDRQFHTALVGAVGNTVMTDLYVTLGDRQQRLGTAAFSAVPGRPERALAQHAQIVEALARFDADRATAVLADHLRTATAELERYLPH
jgi:DNA-binding GntR family transcriptional regulator